MIFFYARLGKTSMKERRKGRKKGDFFWLDMFWICECHYDRAMREKKPSERERGKTANAAMAHSTHGIVSWGEIKRKVERKWQRQERERKLSQYEGKERAKVALVG